MHGHLKRHFKRKNRDKTFVWNQVVRCFELSFLIAKNSDEDPHIQTCEGNTLSKHGCNFGIFTTENRLKEKSAVVNYKCSADLTTWIYTVHSTSKIQHSSVHRLYFLRASVAQSSKQAPFTSEFVGSILATDSCELKESVNALPKVMGFLRALRFPSHRES
jgi:hypothetical protein